MHLRVVGHHQLDHGATGDVEPVVEMVMVVLVVMVVVVLVEMLNLCRRW